MFVGAIIRSITSLTKWRVGLLVWRTKSKEERTKAARSQEWEAGTRKLGVGNWLMSCNLRLTTYVLDLCSSLATTHHNFFRIFDLLKEPCT